MKNRYVVFIWFLLLLTTSCKKQNRFQIKHFDNKVQIEIKRFDLDFINLNTNNLAIDIEALAIKYPDFFPFFLENVLGINSKVFTKTYMTNHLTLWKSRISAGHPIHESASRCKTHTTI